MADAPMASIRDLADDDADLLAVLFGAGLRWLAPAPIEQCFDGPYACSGWRISIAHDGGKRAPPF